MFSFLMFSFFAFLIMNLIIDPKSSSAFLMFLLIVLIIVLRLFDYDLLASYIFKTGLILGLLYELFLFFSRRQRISTYWLSKQDINQIMPLWREAYKNTMPYTRITKPLFFIMISFYVVSIIANGWFWTLFLDDGFSIRSLQFLSGIVIISLHITAFASFILAFLLIMPLRGISSLSTALIEARLKKHYPELYHKINTTPYDRPLINAIKKKGRQWFFGSSSRPFKKNWHLYTRTIIPLPKEI